MTLGVDRLEPEASAIGPWFARQSTRRRMLDAVRLVSRSTLWAGVVAGGLMLFSFAFPILLLLVAPFAVGLLPAAWIAAVGAAAGSLPWRSRAARIGGGAAGAILLLVLAVLFGRGVGLGLWSAGTDPLGWSTYGAAWAIPGLVVVLVVACTRARAPVEARSIVSRGLLASAVAAAAVATAAAIAALSHRPWFDPDDTCGGDGRFEVSPFPVQVTCSANGDLPLAPRSLEVIQVGFAAIAVVLLIGALIVAAGPRRSAATAAIVSSVIAAVLGLAAVGGSLVLPDETASMPYDGRPAIEQPSESAPDPVPDAAEQPPSSEAPLPIMEVPTLAEGRVQFARLAEAALTAAGEGATWRDEPPLEVREEPCDEGVRLVIDGEFATGVITDTTSDEHDREVTAGNVAAADRIAEAWQAVGLGGVERLHDEPHLGRGSFGAVESARISFDFGVAQPRVEGSCLIGE